MKKFLPLGAKLVALGLSGMLFLPSVARADDWPNIPEGKRKEFENGLNARKQWLVKLPEGTVTELDIPYVENPVKGSLPMSSQTLDLYVPKGDGPFPLIVWIHGGAWKGGTKEQQGAELGARWVPEGFAVASMSYRFVMDAPFPGMFQHCTDAIAFLRGNAVKYHLNPEKVGVIGISAGAHIAGVVAMTEGTPAFANSGPPVQAAVLWCGFYDMTKETGQWPAGAFIGNPRDDFAQLYPNRAYEPEIAKKMSPLYQIQPSAPPVLIVHGDKDTTAPSIQTELFANALRKANVQTTQTNYPNYNHNLWKLDVLGEALSFFKRLLQ